MESHCLLWARRLAAIAQNGLTYATSVYDTERCTALREIAVEMMEQASGAALEDIREAFSHEFGYMTPKVDVRAAAFREDRILLVREREDDCWTLPGGWADIGDAPSEVAVRETKEESGYDVRPVKLAAFYDRDRHGHPPIPYHAYKAFFLCELTGGAAATSSETSAVDFFAESELPPLSLTRITAGELHHLFDHLRHPEWPTSFD
jgi:ADP-ribose pyrophosphatase YjhB (NUDIX family)